jgi:hypothetical protein
MAVVAMKPRRVTFIGVSPDESTTVKQNSTATVSKGAEEYSSK